MAEPELVVVIVSYNVRSDLERCLASLAEGLGRNSAAVVVVDNQSTDGTVDWLRQQWPAVTVIEAGANLGFARANNLGIRATASELVLLLNPDTYVPADAVPRLVQALRADPEVAAVGPRLVDGASRPELSFGPMVSPWGEFTQRRLMKAYEAGTPWATRRVTDATRRAADHDWVSGACLLVRRADLEAVGAFDERYFMYFEDVDLCAALRARGRRVRFVPEVTVGHLRGRAAATAPRSTAQRRRESQLAFYRKHLPQWAPLLAWWLRQRGYPVR